MTVVTIVGEIDVYTAPLLREALVELINHRHFQLLLDMSEVDFLDSTGTGVLVGALKRTRAHGGLIGVVNPPPRILKALRISGLTKVIPLFSSVAKGEELLPRLIAALERRRGDATPAQQIA
ncbi:STAS domain-containing protein [Streptomyces sp. 9-7]|uniref:Anti-sigma factor antagonist n=1 Tax=Streptomyces siderophoricus TaxID=2802281 RepID=A0ABS1N0X9_9ACTN|nr:STAS domain-containing protein [Streptomyces sp. 9-7]